MNKTKSVSLYVKQVDDRHATLLLTTGRCLTQHEPFLVPPSSLPGLSSPTNSVIQLLIERFDEV